MNSVASAQNVHASCVVFQGKGVLIIGQSGAGKSSLALQLMALGAELVSDDRTDLRVAGNSLIATSVLAIEGLIEARGVGLLKAAATGPAVICVVIDLDRVEEERLPQVHWYEICRLQLPCLYKIDAPYFPAAIVQYLKGGRQDTS